jgi:hypothetical protein
MRRFSDTDGQPWEAAVGRESWGTFVILFSAVAGGPPRKTMLGAESMLEAQQELDALSEADLQARLASSEPWS